MTRIPDNELVKLKRDVDLVSLVRLSGIELKKHGADLIGLCPFHDDRNPSLVVTPLKNLWHCLGACQKGGSVIDWVMNAEAVSFRRATEILRDGHAPARVQLRKLPAPVAASADDQKILRQVIDYYHESLKKTPVALAYLERRGIKSEAALKRFKLGFSDRSLGAHVAKIRTRLMQTGIFSQTGHEHFGGYIVIPVIDEHGDILEIYGRKIGDKLIKDTPDHLYLPGPHKGVFNPDSLLAAKKEIILCESLIDALSFWVNGFENVTASYGIGGFTDDHFKAFVEHAIKKVYIAYDHDEAGDKAAVKLAAKFEREGMACHRVQFPKGMDANEYVCRVRPADKALRLLLDSAPLMNNEQEKAAKERNEPIEPTQVVTMSPGVPPKVSVPTKINGEDIEITLGERGYRIRGLNKNLSFDVMRVNVRVSVEDRYHIDTLDMYNAKHRTAFIHAAAQETNLEEDVVKKDMGRVLLKLEEMQEAKINATLKPKSQEIKLSEKEREDALALLKNPNLLDRILKDFERCGVVGEETNKLMGYLASVSRKLDAPLAVIIQSSSAAGKSALMEAVLAFVPKEDQVKYSAMTGQSLFYMGGTDLKHKILAIVEEEGAERASYALKLLQSEGELTIASTGKDGSTGKLITHEYHVEGPVMIFLTTTAIEIDEELLNRCLVLTVNEDRAQTRAIHDLQRQSQTLQGLLQKKDRDHILKVHQNASRLLQPLLVANPYATNLTFLDDRTRMRRDHMKYLTLIRTIALLHQYQRPQKTVQHEGQDVTYIEVTPDDIGIANSLAHEVLGRSLDELPPQTRRLLILIDAMVAKICSERAIKRAQYRFSRKEVREHTGWGNTQLKYHLHRLEELEYLLVHRGGRGQSFVYELLYQGEGQQGESFLMGLHDIKTTNEQDFDVKWSGVKGNLSGVNDEKSGCGRGQVGPKSGGGRVEEIGANDYLPTVCREADAKSSKTHIWLKNPDFTLNPYLVSSMPTAFDSLVASAEEAGRLH